MSGEKPSPLFVERRAYRQRRMADAGRLLPLLGIVLVCLPLLWTGPRDEPMKTSDAMIYFFGLWLALTVAALLLSRHLKSGKDKNGDDSGAGGEE